MEIMRNNVVLMFSPTDEETPYEPRDRFINFLNVKWVYCELDVHSILDQLEI